MNDHPMKPLRRNRVGVRSGSPDLQHHLLQVARGSAGHRWTTLDNLAAQLRLDPEPLAGAILECAALGLIRCAQSSSKGRLSLTRAGRRRLDQLERCRRAQIQALQNQLPLPPRAACEGGQPHTQSPGEEVMPRQHVTPQSPRAARTAMLDRRWLRSLHQRASAKIDAALNRLLWSWLSMYAMPQRVEVRIDDVPAPTSRRERSRMTRQRVQR